MVRKPVWIRPLCRQEQQIAFAASPAVVTKPSEGSVHKQLPKLASCRLAGADFCPNVWSPAFALRCDKDAAARPVSPAHPIHPLEFHDSHRCTAGSGKEAGSCGTGDSPVPGCQQLSGWPRIGGCDGCGRHHSLRRALAHRHPRIIVRPRSCQSIMQNIPVIGEGATGVPVALEFGPSKQVPQCAQWARKALDLL